MSLVLFPPKFTKKLLNASFQSADLESSTFYESASINSLQYAPQINQKLVQVTANEIEEEHNKNQSVHCQEGLEAHLVID
jgi:hypothetical protein